MREKEREKGKGKIYCKNSKAAQRGNKKGTFWTSKTKKLFAKNTIHALSEQ